ncbi:PilW family protein [Vibrio sp. SCSIO 43137]|uniref:PilW family protein n=1 Tax=Vibrio sp. SCSIO 43137 TaxID=3021011 RepID=UPI002307E41B|nr:prepilin-type N-terminal cleavage/methylation domain-containing protein [Vibrio sp. SCSIO 43137]WCE30010.1 prepilin-type N-terminal cleavage/methylation domain-containing protein [Vibrio sp. SCSIO 43137]
MRSKGFTLVEMVITIIVLGVIFLGFTGILETGTKGYIDSVDRQKVQNQARFVIEKMSREIRHAVPNSFATTSSTSAKCINFYPIVRSGFYSRNQTSGKVDFVVTNQGVQLPSPVSESLVINPSRNADLTSGKQFKSLSGCRDSADSSCTESQPASGVYVYSIDDDFNSHSVANRYYTYNGEVSYCISSSGNLTRNTVIVAEEVNFTQSRFEYLQATLQRGGLVHLDFLFTNQDEQSFYRHDVQVLNVP